MEFAAYADVRPFLLDSVRYLLFDCRFLKVFFVSQLLAVVGLLSDGGVAVNHLVNYFAAAVFAATNWLLS